MARPVTWGILSTADINRKLIPGAHVQERERMGLAHEGAPEHADADLADLAGHGGKLRTERRV